MAFLKVASAFVAAVRCRVLDVDHAKEPLAHFGRFGPAYDAVCKMLVDVLRDDGMFNGEATTVQHVCGTALQSVSAYGSGSLTVVI
jgi:cohesin complex subunit SA-1/2